MPLACALAVSYRRLAPGRWAAPFQVWGVENREAALRLIPASAVGEPAHLELKVSDLSANPYLLLGAVLAVIEASLQTPRPLPAPVSGDPSHMDDGTAPRLPKDLAAATAAFHGSRGPACRDPPLRGDGGAGPDRLHLLLARGRLSRCSGAGSCCARRRWAQARAKAGSRSPLTAGSDAVGGGWQRRHRAGRPR
nr:hypothetical protein [Cyanobium sp. LEGE 06113]